MKTPVALLVVLAALAAPAQAQEADARWTPWLGCWQMLNDRVREGNPDAADAVERSESEQRGVANGVTVCVAPADRPAAVSLTTRVGEEPPLEQTLVADGTPQAMTEAGCKGTQRLEWSGDGRRLFARAELACGAEPPREISGLAMIAADGTWLDVQAMEIDGRTSVRVRRYRRVDGPRRAGAAWTIDAVTEASGKVSSPALEAALIEANVRFRLNSAALVSLDDAGVPDHVIDLMIALSYPDRFQIERRADADLDLFPPAYTAADWSGYWGHGLGYPYFSWYPGYYGNYRYYYSPFGYGYYGLYGPYSGYYYPGGGTVTPDPADGGGRAIKGVGYTRVHPRDAQPAEEGAGRDRSESGGGVSTPSGGSVTSGGYSQGGGGSPSGSAPASGGGRTAQPR